MQVVRIAMALAAISATALLDGCAHLGVQPWQREVLAREDMQLDANGLDTSFDDHIYFSKEGTSGGRGFGGGGCGCN